MKQYNNFFYALSILLVFILFPQNLFPDDHIIIINGRHGTPTGDDEVNDHLEIIENYLTKKWSPNTEIANTKNEVKNYIENIKNDNDLKCGDNILIYFMGHGTPEEVEYLKDNKGNIIGVKEETIEPPYKIKIKQADEPGFDEIYSEELSGYLDEALKDKPCCVNVHLVINACFAGGFVKEVMEQNDHVITGLSAVDEKHRLFVDFDYSNSYPEQIEDPLSDYPPEPEENWQNKLLEAHKIAIKEISIPNREKNPQSFIRLKGIVENVEKEKNKKTIVLRKPCEERTSDQDQPSYTVVIDSEKKLIVGNTEVEYCQIKEGLEMSVFVRKENNKYIAVSDPKTTPPIFIPVAWGHIESVTDERRIKVSIEHPKFLRGVRTIKLGEGIPRQDWAEWCRFIIFKSSYLVGEENFEIITGDVSQLFRGHIRGIEPSEGVISLHISIPESMWCETIRIENIPQEYFDKEDLLTICNWIYIPVLEEGDRYYYNGWEDVNINFPWIGKIAPIGKRFIGHVDGIERNDKNEIIKIKLKLSEPLNGREVIVRRKDNGVIAFSQRADISKCDDIKIGGYMIDDNNIIITGPGTILSFKENDAGCYRCVLPKTIEPPNSPIPPEISIRNCGDSSISNFQVSCWIDSAGTEIYRDSKLVSNLSPGDTTNVIFNLWTTGPESSIYNVNFKTMLPDDQNPMNDTLSRFVTIIPDTGITNQPPVLSGGDVVPDSGNLLTNFTFGIIYTDFDNDIPVIREVVIDSIAYTMNYISGTPTTGMGFEHNTVLDPGEHVFSFRFDDGHGHTVTTPVYSGPIVETTTMNQPPILTGGDVFPDSGNYISHTPFTYKVNYSDPDGDTAITSEVIIVDENDSTHYTMTLVSGTPLTGAIYQFYKQYLYPGLYWFYFRFDDGHGHMVLTPKYFGPTVTTY